MRLNYNVNSVKIHSTYKKSLKSGATALERISSGLKIKSAKDNAAKIASSERNKFRVRSMEMANKNVQDGISMLQTNDSALQEVSDILARMKELAVNASNGSLSKGDREAVQEELNQLKSSVNDLANNTEFNGIKLLGDTSVVTNLDPNVFKITIGDMVGSDMEIPSFNLNTYALKDKNGAKLSELNVLDAENAEKAIGTVDDIIDQIDKIRGKFGSLQNRLTSAYDNLNANIDITEDGNSKLKDANIATEMMEFARADILSQTGIALITQSNRFPQDALQVLQNVR